MQHKSSFRWAVFSIFMITVLLVGACQPAAAPPPAEEAPAVEEAPAAEAPAAEAKVITVGVNSENPPWIFMDNGVMTGFEADLVEEFAKRAGYTIEYKSAPFATVLTGVQSGQWDVAMSSIWVKQERAEVMDFADPYYDAQIGLMAPSEGGITAFDQMKGKVFGSDTGSANEAWLQEAQAKYGPYEVKSYDYWADAVMDLQAGRIDGVVVDAPIALYWIKQNPDAGISMPLYITDYNFAQALAFEKGSPLVAEFNKVQNEMKKDGTLAAIHRKWFVSDPPADSCAINECPPYMPNEKPGMEKAMEEAPMDVPEKLVVAINGQPSRLLPSKSVGRLNEVLNSMTFEALTTHDENNNLVGLLAESYTNLDDTTWEFKLRPGIKFSNGDPLTAEDVAFTYNELILNEDFGSPHRTFMSTITKVEAIDDLTVHITTSQTDVLLPLRVFDIYGSVVSKKHYESIGDEAAYDADPVGTGPYKFVEWVKDSHILYERNENYWGEMPAYKFMEVRFIPDTAARVNALLAGEVDVSSNIPPERIEEIKGTEGLQVVAAPSNRVHYIVMDTTKPPFDNVDVRMAVSMAIDRDALIQAVQFGLGKPVPSIFMPETFGYNKDVVPVYDPVKAKELLAGAGYPDGFDTEFDTFTGSITDHSKTAEAVTGFLSEIGINAKLNVDEITNWGPKRLALETSPIYNYSFGDALFDHGPNLKTFISGAQGYYYSGDDELSALIDQALAEFDTAKREVLYNEIQKQFYEKGILVGMYQMQQVWGSKADVSYIPQADEMWRLFKIKPQ